MIIEIKRTIGGETDEKTGEWIPTQKVLVATIQTNEDNLQPKTGQQRVYEVQTEYESDYILIPDTTEINFETGFSEIKQNDVAVDESGKKYDVVFPGNWQSHYEIELKAK